MADGERVLIIDSNIDKIRSIDKFLADNGFLVFSAFSNDEAKKKAKEINIDIVIINSASPDIDAAGISSTFKKNDTTKFVPIVVLFNPENKDIKRDIIQSGADCILDTPGVSEELLIAIRSLAKVKPLSLQSEHIEDAFYGLVKIIDAKDAYTKGHSERVAKVSKVLAQGLSLPDERIRMLEKAAKLHDIGNINIPEAILNKPGALTEEEYNYIKQHPVISEKICAPLISLKPILPIIRHHHERYDGKGYPDGLRGEDIPLEARIIAVADCFDAMATDRPYRKKLPRDRIITIFNAGAGAQWDKHIVEVLIKFLEDGTIENTNLYNFD